MGVFEAVTSVVLEAGRMKRPAAKPVRVKERAWRLRLAYVPALPVVGVGLAIVVGVWQFMSSI